MGENQIILLSIKTQKKVYAFLSKTIYNELIEYGIDDEYIFTFSLYLHWVVIKTYTNIYQEPPNRDVKVLLHNIRTTSEVRKNEYNQNLDNFIDTLFADNSEMLISIYEDVYKEDLPLMWLKEWQNLCKSCYSTNKSKIPTCLTLLKIVNECLSMPVNQTDISLNILLRIEKSRQQV